MSLVINSMEMPKNCNECPMYFYEGQGICSCRVLSTIEDDEVLKPWKKKRKDCPLIEIPDKHGRLIDADALTVQMERNLWAIEDKAEKELGFNETLRRGMQYGHAVCLDAVNDAAVILVPQIVHCCECEYNNHCLTQEFVEEESKIPFDKNTWFCANAKAAFTIIPEEEGE